MSLFPWPVLRVAVALCSCGPRLADGLRLRAGKSVAGDQQRAYAGLADRGKDVGSSGSMLLATGRRADRRGSRRGRKTTLAPPSGGKRLRELDAVRKAVLDMVEQAEGSAKEQEDAFCKQKKFIEKAKKAATDSIKVKKQRAKDASEAEKIASAKQAELQVRAREARENVEKNEFLMEKAEREREKESKEFAAQKADMDQSVQALAQTLLVLEKKEQSDIPKLLQGTSGSFLRQREPQLVESLLSQQPEQGAESSPDSDLLGGILTTLRETMLRDKADLEQQEKEDSEKFERNRKIGRESTARLRNVLETLQEDLSDTGKQLADARTERSAAQKYDENETRDWDVELQNLVTARDHARKEEAAVRDGMHKAVTLLEDFGKSVVVIEQEDKEVVDEMTVGETADETVEGREEEESTSEQGYDPTSKQNIDASKKSGSEARDEAQVDQGDAKTRKQKDQNVGMHSEKAPERGASENVVVEEALAEGGTTEAVASDQTQRGVAETMRVTSESEDATTTERQTSSTKTTAAKTLLRHVQESSPLSFLQSRVTAIEGQRDVSGILKTINDRIQEIEAASKDAAAVHANCEKEMAAGNAAVQTAKHASTLAADAAEKATLDLKALKSAAVVAEKALEDARVERSELTGTIQANEKAFQNAKVEHQRAKIVFRDARSIIAEAKMDNAAPVLALFDSILSSVKAEDKDAEADFRKESASLKSDSEALAAREADAYELFNQKAANVAAYEVKAASLMDEKDAADKSLTAKDIEGENVERVCRNVLENFRS
ncbi:unnamed protein product, partial [Amoebophrya sp. A25]|eukprot:GSA25T00001920001.1